MKPANCPDSPLAFYSDDVIQNPWPHYETLRALGPVVWLSELGNFALTQYDVVREALRDNKTYISGEGTAGDAFGCTHQRGNTVASDPPRHTIIRSAMQPPLLRPKIEALRSDIQSVANQLVADCLKKPDSDAIKDLAQGLPLSVVRDFVGLPDFGKDNMLKWAGAAFDMQGIQNARGQAAVAKIAEMRNFITRDVTPETLKPGSWTHRILELAGNGDLDPELAPFAIRDYINPSLDTTISAIGQMLYHLGKTPELFEQIKSDPSLIPNAAHEAVRISTPIRSFSRHTSRETSIAGIPLPKGARVMMLFASANRDETVFANADRFDPARSNARRHLGFGAGIHMCVGMHLAVLEIECLLQAMVDQIASFTIGSPKTALNNTICAFETLPIKLNAA